MILSSLTTMLTILDKQKNNFIFKAKLNQKR